jgi:hypothetical protein
MKKQISIEEFNRLGRIRQVENALDGITEQERQQRELQELIQEREKTAEVHYLVEQIPTTEEIRERLKSAPGDHVDALIERSHRWPPGLDIYGTCRFT